MDRQLVIDASINNRRITLKREWYWGLAFGFVVQNDPRDFEMIFIIPFFCIQIEIEKK